MDARGFAQAPEPFGVFALGQMAATGARAQRLARCGDLEPLSHGLSRFDAFGTSHKLFKRTRSIRLQGSEARGKTKNLGMLIRRAELIRGRVGVPILFHGVLNPLVIGHFALADWLDIINESFGDGPPPVFDMTVYERNIATPVVAA
jgi:hypothetical protein